MAFRIKVNDVPIEVDTAEELLSLLAKMGAFEGKPKASGVLEELPSRIHIPSASENMVEFYKQIRRSRSLMLNILEELYKVDNLTTAELINVLSVETGHAFGGAVAGITKIAERCMLRAEDVLSKDRDKASGEIRYRLTPSLREVIRTEKELPARIPKPFFKI